MDWFALLFLILIAILPPILFAKLYFWVRKKLKYDSNSRWIVVYVTSFTLWLSALGGFVTINTSYRSSSPPPPTGNKPTDIPKFPWPPPSASSFVIIPLLTQLESSDLVSTRQLLLRDADNFLKYVLHNAGHSEFSYYSAPGGYALVSRLEQIEEDGSPKPSPERWGTREIKLNRFRLRDYLQALFLAPPGYYRLVVFVISTQPFAQSPDSISRDIAQSWLRLGANALPNNLAIQPLTDQYLCTALIYEFEKFDTDDQAKFRQPGRLSAQTHIEKSGIGRYLL